MGFIKAPKFYTRELLKITLPKYCRGKTIDVGAGCAKYREIIEQYSDSYVTVDNLSSDYQFKGSGLKTDIVADVLKMPLNNAEFDTVICTEVLEHVSDPFGLFSEIARILKVGGHAIISSAWAAPYHQEPKDYWRFSPDAYELLACRNGLEIIEIHQKGGFFSLIFYFLSRSVDLNTKKLRKAANYFFRINLILAKVFECFDKYYKTQDSIGHLVVVRKKI
ncbi:methyltransferase domain-containing protein [Patescibacteria group bacterium]|nr:methyltransferase domain-containing protein [Patescibacteria group bacterium]